jgi:hypothetical protein
MQSYGAPAAPRIGLIGGAMTKQPKPKKKPRHIEVRAHVRRKPKRK